MTRSLILGFGSLITLCATSGLIYYIWATPALTTPNNTTRSGYIFFDYQRWKRPFQAIFRVNADGTNLTRLTSGWYSDRVPEACAAAQKVAFISYRNGNGDIYIMDFDGANQIALTSDPSTDGYPRFSQDCQQIVFFSNRTGTYQIYSKTIDNTSPLQQLTFGPGDKFDPVISSDGAYLSFTSDIDGVHNIYIINRTDNTQTQLTQSMGNDVHAAFDPLVEKITFRSNRNGAYEIFVMNIDGSDQQQLTFDDLSTRHPSFSPDGTKIIFHTVSKPGSSALAIVPTLGGDVTYLTSFTGAHLNPAWVSVSLNKL